MSKPNSIERVNYYTLLGVAQDAEVMDIRQGYRRALLQAHPDKHVRLQNQHLPIVPGVVISQLQDAFRTLSDPQLRATYDQLFQEGKGEITLTSVKQRPASEVSLDEFDSEEITISSGKIVARWTYPCRCGGLFIIEEQELEAGVHYIGCGGCSEVVWVGYELVDDVQAQENGSNAS